MEVKVFQFEWFICLFLKVQNMDSRLYRDVKHVIVFDEKDASFSLK